MDRVKIFQETEVVLGNPLRSVGVSVKSAGVRFTYTFIIHVFETSFEYLSFQ